MDNNIQQSQTVQENNNVNISDSQIPPVPLTSTNIQPTDTLKMKKTDKKWKILTLVGVAILLVIAFFGILFFQGIKDAPQIQQKITTFLQDASSGNYDAAYALMSKQLQGVLSLNDFEQTIKQNGNAQYSGFEEQKQTSFKVQTSAGQPNLYIYTGIITYTDGSQGEVYAQLVNESGDWKINDIKVNVSENRIKKFQPNGGQ